MRVMLHLKQDTTHEADQPKGDEPAELSKAQAPEPWSGDSRLPSEGSLPPAQQTVKAASADVSMRRPSFGKVWACLTSQQSG